METTNRAWLGVVSCAHVQGGAAGGFAQLCHGKAAPLRKMQKGDWLIYYSPTVEMHGAPRKAFTAIGQVEDDEVFEHGMIEGTIAYRRRIKYLENTHQVPLADLQPQLELCAKPNWGMQLRRGHLPLSAADFQLIAKAMGALAATR